MTTENQPNKTDMNGLAKFFEYCANHSDALYKGLLALCVVLFAADFLYHKHAHFDFEQLPGFYGLFGLASYCGIVLTAKQLRKILKRDEDYYDVDDARDDDV